MPLYEYECKKCHHRFERIVKYSDLPMKKCPDCGGPVEQTITAPAVQFKGSGWYVTDYAKKPSATASSNGDSSSKEESASKKEAGSKESGSKESGSKESSSKEESASKKEEKRSKSTEKPKSETSSKKAEKK